MLLFIKKLITLILLSMKRLCGAEVLNLFRLAYCQKNFLDQQPLITVNATDYHNHFVVES